MNDRWYHHHQAWGRVGTIIIFIFLLSGCFSATTSLAPTPDSIPEEEPTTILLDNNPFTTDTVSAMKSSGEASVTIEQLTVPQPCQRPPDDYSRVVVNDFVINARTSWMLHLAEHLYQGRGDPLRVTQGSYTTTEDASFGTHAGGGVVDISIRVENSRDEILTVDEANELVHALRMAGMAAWLRMPDDLDPPVPLHIHAVAIGDRELSEAARRQLDGPEGYFRGWDGVPPGFGGPHSDRHGGPVVCDWMVELGFDDLR